MSIRGALVLLALVTSGHLAEWSARVRFLVRITGWMTVAGLVITAVAIVRAHGNKAVIAGALATAVAASLLIIEPAVERSAFQTLQASQSEAPSVSARG